MNAQTLLKCAVACLIGGLLCFVVPSGVNAHCDTMDGPVVQAARKALETGNINLVLIWVQKKDEAEIRAAFQKTLAVRGISSEARDLADMYFFESLVRIHRAGEGVPYTGLKSSGATIESGIEAADRALESGSPDSLLIHLKREVLEGVHHQFEQVMQKKNFKTDDVEAGREFVKAYVGFIHYVDRLYQAASKPAAGHFNEAEGTGIH